MSSQTQASEQRSPCRVGVWTGLNVTRGNSRIRALEDARQSRVAKLEA